MNDLISRKVAINDLQGKDPSQVWDTADIEVWVNALPSVQPERKTGRWEDINKNYYCRICGRCSACGWEAHLYEDDVVGMPYCPNCGAKMEGGK